MVTCSAFVAILLLQLLQLIVFSSKTLGGPWPSGPPLSFGPASKISNARKKDILSKYNSSVPAEEVGKDLDFWVYLCPLRIRNLDEKTGVASLEIITETLWSDKRLSWNTSLQYEFMDIPFDIVWKPQIHFFHRAQPDDILLTPPANAGSKGRVYAVEYRILHLPCVSYMRWYPFDTHQCDLQVGAWDVQGDVLNPIRPSKRDTDITDEDRNRGILVLYYYADTTRWVLEDHQDQLKMYSEFEGYDIPLITSRMIIRRRAPLIALGVLCPSILATILGLASYWLQPGKAARLALPLTATLVVNVALDTVQRLAGSGRGETPIISDLCATCLVLLLLACLQALLVSFLVRLTSDPPPALTRTVFNLPTRLLRLWGLDPEPADLYQEDEGGLLQDWPLKTKLDWKDFVGIFDGFGLTFNLLALFILIAATLVTA